MIFAWILGMTASAWLSASNFHEHLFSLPSPRDIREASEEIFLLPEKKQRLSEMFKNSEELYRFLKYKWNEDEAKDFVENGGYDKTFLQLCQNFKGSPKANLEKILAYDFDETAPIEDRRLLYIDLEDIRKTLFLGISAKGLENIFRHYFEHESLVNRRIISATVTRRFFGCDQNKKYRRLRDLAQKYGTQLVYRVSLQRQDLLKTGIALNQESFCLLKKGEIGGIDLVGSLQEKTYVYSQSQAAIEEKLVLLFDYISDHSLVLVMHLFEGENKDSFYQALENVLKTYRKPILLEIGHIACIDSRWIGIFASNPNLNVLFHVNARSNQLLHDCSVERLQQTVHKLNAAGFPVVPGCDGRGILPGATYCEQVALLDCPLHDKSFLSMK